MDISINEFHVKYISMQARNRNSEKQQITSRLTKDEETSQSAGLTTKLVIIRLLVIFKFNSNFQEKL